MQQNICTKCKTIQTNINIILLNEGVPTDLLPDIDVITEDS